MSSGETQISSFQCLFLRESGCVHYFSGLVDEFEARKAAATTQTLQIGVDEVEDFGRVPLTWRPESLRLGGHPAVRHVPDGLTRSHAHPLAFPPHQYITANSMSFMDQHNATWATSVIRPSDSLQRRGARPYPHVNRSFAEATLEDESSGHEDSEKKRIEDSLSLFREQFASQLKSQSDESRNCYKMLSDQLVSLESRVRAQEKDGNNKLDLYKVQVELEGRVMKQNQEMKSMLGEFARTDDVKSLEDGLKRANSLKLQTLEYRLKELSDSFCEFQSILHQLLQKDRSPPLSQPKPDELINQVFTASVQRIDKLLERELIPLINDQESRLAAGLDRRIREMKDESRSVFRADTDLKQRMNTMEESFRELMSETAAIRSQTQGAEMRSSMDSQVSQLREELKAFERTVTQSVSFVKGELQGQVSRVDGELKTACGRLKEAEGGLGRVGDLVEARISSASIDLTERITEKLKDRIAANEKLFEKLRKEEFPALAQSLLSSSQASSAPLRTLIEQLKTDLSESMQRISRVESRLAEVEEKQYSAQASPDALNESMVIDKSSISIEKEEGLATFGEPEMVEKVASRTKGMKGGIRGIQQLQLQESSDESREDNRSSTPNLTAEQITSALLKDLLGQEIAYCLSVMKGPDLVLSSLDSYRETGKGLASPLLSWDPDEEQDDGVNLSDRRVDLRAMRRPG